MASTGGEFSWKHTPKKGVWAFEARPFLLSDLALAGLDPPSQLSLAGAQQQGQWVCESYDLFLHQPSRVQLADSYEHMQKRAT